MSEVRGCVRVCDWDDSAASPQWPSFSSTLSLTHSARRCTHQPTVGWSGHYWCDTILAQYYRYKCCCNILDSCWRLYPPNADFLVITKPKKHEEIHTNIFYQLVYIALLILTFNRFKQLLKQHSFYVSYTICYSLLVHTCVKLSSNNLGKVRNKIINYEGKLWLSTLTK